MRPQVLLLALTCGTGACSSVKWYPMYADLPVDKPSTDQASRSGMTGDVVHAFVVQGTTVYPANSAATRQRLESPWLRALLFPVNLVADMAGNVVAALIEPFGGGCCMAVPSEVLEGVFFFGPLDAWHGYPFWEPTAADPESIDLSWSL